MQCATTNRGFARRPQDFPQRRGKDMAAKKAKKKKR
jgi:hypothetical protein